MAAGKSNGGGEVELYQQYALAQADTAGLLDVLRENMGAGALTAFDLERVKMPTGGGQLWSLPTLTGEPEDVRTIDGIIVYHRDPRAYWQTTYEEQPGTPPDCSSAFGDVGIGVPGGDCARCPFAQYGSKPLMPGQTVSRGQACRATKLLCILREDALLPLVLFVPPTSLRPMRQYLLGLTSRGRHYSSVITRLALERTKNADGVEYSVVKPSMLETLDGAGAGRVREYAEALRSVLDTVTLTAEDIPVEEG